MNILYFVEADEDREYYEAAGKHLNCYSYSGNQLKNLDEVKAWAQRDFPGQELNFIKFETHDAFQAAL